MSIAIRAPDLVVGKNEDLIYTRTELETAFHESPLKHLIWGIVRNEHEAKPRDEALKLIQSVYPLPLKYNHETRNCDEFAEMLRWRVWQETGWRGIGIICDYDGRHMYNMALLVDDSRPVFELVEPQTGEFVVPGSDFHKLNAERYDLQRGWLML